MESGAVLAGRYRIDVFDADVHDGRRFIVTELLSGKDLAKDLTSSSKVTVAGEIFGTPACMAPEQWRAAAVGPGADLYAAGCILYEMVTGRAPFEGPSLPDLMEQHLTRPPVPTGRSSPSAASTRQPGCGLWDKPSYGHNAKDLFELISAQELRREGAAPAYRGEVACCRDSWRTRPVSEGVGLRETTW